MRHHPDTVAINADARAERSTLLHLEGAPSAVRTWASAIHILAGQEHLSFDQHAA
jgi:hypothetical protein